MTKSLSKGEQLKKLDVQIALLEGQHANLAGKIRAFRLEQEHVRRKISKLFHDKTKLLREEEKNGECEVTKHGDI